MSEVIDITVDEDQQEGTTSVLQKWLKQPGDFVSAHEPLAELETDKVVVEIPAPADGVVAELLKSEGEEVTPGEVLGRLRPQAEEPLVETAAAAVEQIEQAEGAVSGPVQTAAEDTEGRTKLSPVVRRLVREHELDPSDIAGTGRGGRISVRDVQNYLQARGKASPPPSKEWLQADATGTMEKPAPAAVVEPVPAVPEPPEFSDGIPARIVPHTPMRRRIAQHMVESVHTAPHVTTVFEADMSAVIAHRNKHKALYAQRSVKLTFTAYYVSACIEALHAVPEVNSRFHEEHLEIFDDINIGVATSLGNEGLVVPVLHRVQQQNLFGIAERLQELTRRARGGELRPADVQHGTFTISNHGVSGSLLASPIIINQPQSAILGVGRLQKRVFVNETDGQDAMQIRPMCYVTLTIDHRALDAHQANSFLTRLVEVLENWP